MNFLMPYYLFCNPDYMQTTCNYLKNSKVDTIKVIMLKTPDLQTTKNNNDWLINKPLRMAKHSL